MYATLVSLLLGSFAIGTTEFVVAGLLPSIAADLGVTVPQAGFLVTGYALCVAIGGPILALIAARFPRKPALLVIVAIFFAGQILGALAPTFTILMIGRAISAAAHGSYFGLAILMATSIMPPGKRGMALAIVVGGINVANIIGVPLGTAVGTAFGWRSAFVMVALISLANFIAIALFAPNPPRAPAGESSFAAQLRAARTPKVLTSYALIVLHMTAFWSVSTFVAPYFIEAGGVSHDLLPVILFAFGIAGGLGVVAGGRYADRYPVGSLTRTYPVLAACFVLAWLGTPWWWPLGVAAFCIVWTVGSITVVAVQNRVLAGAAAAPELASSLISAVFNVGIAAGAALGSNALARGLPVAQLPVIAVIFLATASLLAVAATRGETRART